MNSYNTQNNPRRRAERDRKNIVANADVLAGGKFNSLCGGKKHIGIYPGGEAVAVFAERLTGYKTSKGAIQFPLNKPIDYALIADIVKWRLRTCIHKIFA